MRTSSIFSGGGCPKISEEWQEFKLNEVVLSESSMKMIYVSLHFPDTDQWPFAVLSMFVTLEKCD